MRSGPAAALLALALAGLAACADEPALLEPSPVTGPPAEDGGSDPALAGLPAWVETPAGLQAGGDLVAVGFGLGPTHAPETAAAADARARLELARALVPVIAALLADLERRNPLVTPLREPSALDLLPGQVAEAALGAVQLGEVHALPSRGVLYRRARLAAADLIAAYRALLVPELEAARSAGRMPAAGWSAVEQHLAALPERLAAGGLGDER